MSNGFASPGLGTCPVCPDLDMAAFDALPTPVRARLREAPVKVAAKPLWDFWMSDPRDCRGRTTAIESALDRVLGVPT